MNQQTPKLIITIDDLGPNSVVAERALNVFRKVRATRASVLVNMTWAPGLARNILEAEIPLGLHLNFSAGRPVLEASVVPTLVGADGSFHASNKTKNLGHIAPSDLKREAIAQVDKFIAMGFQLRHLDNHRPEIYFRAECFRQCIELANEFKIPLRYPLRNVGELQLKIIALAYKVNEADIAFLKKTFDKEFNLLQVPSAEHFFADSYPGGLPSLFTFISEGSFKGVVEVAVHLEGEEGRKNFDFLMGESFAEMMAHSIHLVTPSEWVASKQ